MAVRAAGSDFRAEAFPFTTGTDWEELNPAYGAFK
jgi:hypothetical protein